MKFKTIFYSLLFVFFTFINNGHSQEPVPNEYNLSKNDIIYIRTLLIQTETKNILELPTPIDRPNVSKYFKLLRNQNSEKWVGAYLFLLTIVPQLFIEDEIGC